MRSYVAEAMTSGNAGAAPDLQEAELYMKTLNGSRGWWRSLLPKAEFEVRITKIKGIERNSS